MAPPLDAARTAIRTKIVATLGPSTSDPTTVARLIEAGLSVARVNFSHGTHDEHRQRIELVRAAAADAGRHVAILQDLQGPRLRLGNVGKGTILEPGSRVVLDGLTAAGTRDRLPIGFAREVAGALRPGHLVLIGDGALQLAVVEAGLERVVAEVLVGGEVSSRKGVNLPNTAVDLPAITRKDRADLALGIELGVDYVALSFVGSGQDVERLRRLIRRGGADIPIVSKIERQAAVTNIREIVETSDAIMVARGDLALEIGAAQVPLVQKQVIRLANAAGVPVITATQMLESMVRNPTPTRAETSDVANAILDGSDAVMLSGETAIGRYPIEVVQEMRTIAVETEPGLAHVRIGRRAAEFWPWSPTQAISEAAVDLARRLHVTAIIAPTTTGSTARAVAKHRPEMLLIGAAQQASVCRQLALVWGVTPILVGKYRNTDEMVKVVGTACRERGLLAEGDTFVVISGQPVGRPGSTNMIQVRKVGDWAAAR